MRFAITMVTAAVCLALPTWAAEAPKKNASAGIDFTRPLLGVDGKPILDQEKNPLTMGNVAANCLVQEKAANGQGPALWALAMKIATASNVALDATEIHAIEGCLADRAPLLSGQIDPAIDPNFKAEPLK